MSSMGRRARIVIPDLPHHVVHRGNHSQQVFFCDDDRLEYLRILTGSARKYDVRIISFCLMDNHVHLIAVPPDKNSLGLLFRRALMLYSRYINENFDWTGHLWQGRYYSSPMDLEYLYTAVRYVERNPVRAHMVSLPWEYPWSSAVYRISGYYPSGLLSRYEPLERMVGDWADYLSLGLQDSRCEELRSGTSSGRPLGSDAFIQRIEAATKSDFAHIKRGRPPDWM